MKQAKAYWAKKCEEHKLDSNPVWIDEAIDTLIEISYKEGQVRECGAANRNARIRGELKKLTI